MSSPAMHPYAIVDVFTDVPLEGNQVAVFSDGAGLSDELMQRVARELNLSETVFLLAPDDGADARVRIFTPVSELPFAGHPVLGTAFLLGDRLAIDLVRLQTGLGVVPIALTREGDQIVFGEMEQPIPPIEPFEHADELLSALGVARSELPVQAYLNGPIHVYVGLESEAAVAALVPDMNALAAIGVFGVNCFAGSGTSFKVRMFAPGLGVSGRSRHRLGGGSARGPPGPPWPDRLRRPDRDPAGRRDPSSFYSLRAGGGQWRRDRAGPGRGQGRARGGRGIPAVVGGS